MAPAGRQRLPLPGEPATIATVFRIVHDGGSFRVHREAGGVRVRIEGVVGHEADEDGLVATFDALHREALGGDRLELDLVGVPHMSAVGLRALLHWVRRIAGEEPRRRYTLVLLSNPDHPWQRTSLRNLARIAGDTLQIEA